LPSTTASAINATTGKHPVVVHSTPLMMTMLPPAWRWQRRPAAAPPLTIQQEINEQMVSSLLSLLVNRHSGHISAEGDKPDGERDVLVFGV